MGGNPHPKGMSAPGKTALHAGPLGNVPYLADGTPIPREAFWKTVTGVATTDPEYQRAFGLCKQRLKEWFHKKYPLKAATPSLVRKFNTRSPYWSHILADYCMWACVNDELKPEGWPRTTAKFAEGHHFSIGELAVLLQRVRFKTLFNRLYPPIPTYLLVQKVDAKMFKALANDDNWEGPKKDLKAMNSLANTFYTRYGVIKKGGNLTLVNNQNLTTDERFKEVPAEVLHESLKLVLPYLRADELEAVGLDPVGMVSRDAELLPAKAADE